MKPDKICHLDDYPEFEIGKPLESDLPIQQLMKYPSGKEVYCFDESMAEWEESLRARALIAAHRYLARHGPKRERWYHEERADTEFNHLVSIQIGRQIRQRAMVGLRNLASTITPPFPPKKEQLH